MNQGARRASHIPDNEKIIHLSDAELEALNFIGPDAVQPVKEFIDVIKRVPQQFEWLTAFQLQCLDTLWRDHVTPVWQISPRSNEANLSESRVVQESDLVSPFERAHFYTGVSEDHPPLLHRSDIVQHPFSAPQGRFSTIPEKTAHSANHLILKSKLWKEDVAPEIISLLKDPSRGVRVSKMLPVRFSTPDEDGNAVFDDYIVLWISVHPNTTKETSCRDVNSDILSIFAKHGIQDVVVHWIEGVVEPLGLRDGFPPIMRVVWDTNPTHYIRRALTAALGVPLSAEASESSDAEGSLGLYFHEGKGQHGDESKRMMCLTSKHVASPNTTRDYDYSNPPGLPKQFIRNCSSRRFQQIINETRALVATKLNDVKFYAEQLADMMADPCYEDQEGKERKQQDLKRSEQDVVKVAEFLQLLTSTWSDDRQRIIGYLDWAPKVASDLDNRHYTRDLSVIALDDARLGESCQGNVICLAGKYAPDEIASLLNANDANQATFKYPKDHLFRLSGHVDAAGLANPYLSDENGKPGFIVAKAGQSTDLTFGRLSELEAYTCDEFGHESWEVAVLNFSKKHGSFSAKGDSGAAVFNAEGKLVAILHSGMPRGKSNHVTFGTPGHYVVELVKERYPHADFDCVKFDL